MKAVPVTQLNPINEWQTELPLVGAFSPEYFLHDKATLIKGTGDLFSFILTIIRYSNRVADSGAGGGVSISRPAYVKGDAHPSSSSFLKQLQKINSALTPRNFPVVCKNHFQDFPLFLEESPFLGGVFFKWLVVNSAIPPWRKKGDQSSLFEQVLKEIHGFPTLVILEGFSWNESMADLRKMLMRLKQRHVSTIVIAPELPPNYFALHSVWDNVVDIRPWRSWRCSPNNLVLRFLKCNGLKAGMRCHLVVENDGIFWQEKFDGFEFLRPLISQWVRDGRKAREIVYMINDNLNLSSRLRRPMTLSNLARLKREWGLRSYKPEKKPRKKRSTTSTQDSPTSSAEMN